MKSGRGRKEWGGVHTKAKLKGNEAGWKESKMVWTNEKL